MMLVVLLLILTSVAAVCGGINISLDDLVENFEHEHDHVNAKEVEEEEEAFMDSLKKAEYVKKEKFMNNLNANVNVNANSNLLNSANVSETFENVPMNNSGGINNSQLMDPSLMNNAANAGNTMGEVVEGFAGNAYAGI